MLSSLRRFSEDEVAQQRLKVIKFYQQYGEKATKEAFGADRKFVYIWRKRLKDSRGRLFSLIPHSTSPKKVRRMATDQRIVEFIGHLREAMSSTLEVEKLRHLKPHYQS